MQQRDERAKVVFREFNNTGAIMEEVAAETTEDELWVLVTSDDQEQRAWALHTLAIRKQERGGLAESLSEAATARRLFAELALPEMEASAGWFEARALNAHEDYAATIAVLERTIELYRSHAAETLLADAISFQAKAFASLGWIEEAENGYRSAIALYKSNDCFQQAGYYTLAVGDLQNAGKRQFDAIARSRPVEWWGFSTPCGSVVLV
jgi:tetratricopeptide (TPR) repeat protein